MKSILIGADPEVFISKKGKIISVEGLLGGTKEIPFKYNHWEPGCAVQEDNVLAEYNIPPCDNVDDFMKYNKLMINRVSSILRANTGDVHDVEILASHKFKASQLVTEQALMFGCDPDINCWTGDFNQAPDSVGTLLRSAGGHLHLGWKEPNLVDQFNIAKFADLFLGLPSVLIDRDTRRKHLYGKSGAIRFKDYGIEYRTLSNFWLKSDKLMTWAFEQAVRAIEIGLEYKIDEELSSRIQTIINTNDVIKAKRFIMELRGSDTQIKLP